MKIIYVYSILVIIIVGGLIFIKVHADKTASDPARMTVYDTFAQCLTDAGAKFYGAYWCPHCQSQKRMFDNSKNLPYVECSTPNGKEQIQICTDAGITGYPTWTFADGSQLDGERSLVELAEKTNCTPPEA